jgi:serine/threonine protein kinase
MEPFSAFDLDGKSKAALAGRHPALPPWLASLSDQRFAWRLLHYAETGSTRRRLHALSKCAAILARLHCAGLVYGDISANNVFIGKGGAAQAWLIDADNLRFEQSAGGVTVYTPGHGAPEIVRGTDATRPRSDCWAFAVMAFKMLALCDPFIGKRVLESQEESGWDTDSSAGGAPVDLYERAHAGYFPFVDDEDDDSNEGRDGLPRELVATAGIRRLFQETFGAGRERPHLRPAMLFWALELARACDRSLECPNCRMSYFADAHRQCSYCGTPRPAFIRAKTRRWEIVIAGSAREFELPHRLFHPFSLEHQADAEYEGIPVFHERTVFPARGTRAFPEGLTFEFVEAET